MTLWLVIGHSRRGAQTRPPSQGIGASKCPPTLEAGDEKIPPPLLRTRVSQSRLHRLRSMLRPVRSRISADGPALGANHPRPKGGDRRLVRPRRVDHYLMPALVAGNRERVNSVRPHIAERHRAGRFVEMPSRQSALLRSKLKQSPTSILDVGRGLDCSILLMLNIAHAHQLATKPVHFRGAVAKWCIGGLYGKRAVRTAARFNVSAAWLTLSRSTPTLSINLRASIPVITCLMAK
jgi:hypothetical protein